MASLPYPRCRPRGCSCLCCTNRTSGEEAPTECTEYTEPLAEKELPQMARMRTDVGGYGIPAIPTLTNSVDSVNSVGEKIFPQNARNAQKLLAEKNLPQMSTELTEPLAEKSLPQTARMFTDVGGYGIPAIPTLPNSVNSVGGHSRRRGYGKMPYPPKEKSVGGHLSRRFCEFGVFRGRISHSRRRGYGKMPYPPKEESVGGHLIKL